jgi:hypothetical protein
MKKLSFQQGKLFLLLLPFLLTVILFPIFGFSQTSNPVWQAVSEENVPRRGQRYLHPEQYQVFRLNQKALAKILASAPLEFTAEARLNQTVLTVPKPDGKFISFRIEESPILAPEVAAKYPNWKTYQGYGIDEPGTTARFDLTDSGFHGYIFSADGTFSIDPFQANDRENYLVFYKNQFSNRQREFHCRLDQLLSEEGNFLDLYNQPLNFVSDFSHGTQIRTYRLAVATTFEYTNFFRQTGDTDAQAQTRAFNQVVTSINRVTGIYRKELAVSFNLVSNTNLVYVVNPETPANYNNDGSSADLNANQTNVDSVIGSSNYDVGHLFQTGDGGIAQLSSVCGASKARGLSGLPNPTGDPFDVDYVAHELGHQFAANHTFNATSNCGSSPAAARKEPGSAVTIMGYSGICSSTANLQRNSIEIFHVHNLTESINFITTGNGSTCGTLSGSNAVPVITPLSNYTIPFNTPFSLTASATDANGDTLTYSWEQNDPSAATSNYPSMPDDDDTSLVFRPGFRSYMPTTNPTRTFPSLPYILNNSNEAPLTYTGTSATGSICAGTCITGEDLPSAARTMNFRVSVRDGQGGVADAGTVITVVNTTTPFRVTTQNTSPVAWNGNSNQNITWDVSGTTGSGINTANVKISLSTNGGQSFPIILAESTPNDGSHTITVPNVATSQARIKVEAVGNIFFDVNDANFTIVQVPSGRRFVDFDGDGKTDLSIFRPNNGQWWYLRSSDSSNRVFQFGLQTDILAPGDFTGDGKTDIAVFRPSTGTWFVMRSEDNSFFTINFGTNGDIPAPGDFDGDGKTDAAVFRPSDTTWYILRSGGGTTFQQFGIAEDKPTVADYDGDGKDDIAIYRPSVSQWWILRSTGGVIAYQFGLTGDKAVPGDYTGDGKADVAVFRPTNGNWFVLRSEDNSFFATQFGATGDVAVQGDYDGDGKFDLGVFRPSANTWYLNRSTSGILIAGYGASGDLPVPNAFVR